MCRPCARRKSPRAPSLRFIERRVSGDRPVRSVWPFSCRRAPPRKYTVTGLRHSSKRCSPRQRRLDQKREILPVRPARRLSTSALVVGCGACIAPWASSADFRPGRGRKVRACMVPSASAARLIHFARFVSLRPRDHVENSWPRDDEAKTRWPNGNARTLPLVDRIRSEFRNRKLQETRPRCRLIERRSSRERLELSTFGPRFFSSHHGRD